VDIGHEAEIPNPALGGLQFLVGTWRTEGIHPLVPGKIFHGRTVFEWAFGGAFLVMRSEIEEPEIPSGIAIFASDDAAGERWASYFDQRGVSRRYVVTIGDGEITWERDDEAFSQRMTLRAEPDGRAMTGTGRMRKNGGAWEDDLTLTYRRD
jgi:hypothetical protein